MINTFQLIILLVLSSLAVVNAQTNITECGDEQLQAYQACVQENPCTCSNCDANPMDNYPVIALDAPPQNCQDVARIFCPLMRCCAACEQVAQQWYTCAFDDFSVSQLDTTCPQVCEAFELNDYLGGDCQPTVAPEMTTVAPTVMDTATPDTLAPSTSAAAAAASTLNPTVAPTVATTESPTVAPFASPSAAAQVSSMNAATSTSGARSSAYFIKASAVVVLVLKKIVATQIASGNGAAG
ncbi:hypothetical protein MPSEU_000113500 [Mayamaea pseudoterrestris]|nr:hypothetical protein MPSEU_000113500 [Mayamaea pseudoterrestris]